MHPSLGYTNIRSGQPRSLLLNPVFLLFYPEGANRRKNLPPKVPITPMPRYSIMETPVLKKELDRLVVVLKACSSVVPSLRVTRRSEAGSCRTCRQAHPGLWFGAAGGRGHVSLPALRMLFPQLPRHQEAKK